MKERKEKKVEKSCRGHDWTIAEMKFTQKLLTIIILHHFVFRSS